MEFEYLDHESEEKLKEILSYEELPQNTLRGYTVEHLVKRNFLVGLCTTTLSDVEPCYIISGITQKGKAYFELKTRYEKEKRTLSYREWKIAIVSAIIGGVVGLLPTMFQLF